MKKLGEFLLEKGILTEEKLKIALEKQNISKDKLGNILIKLGFIKESVLNKLLAEQYRLEAFDKDDLLITVNVQKNFPKNIIEKYKVIPLEFNEKDFKIAISDMSVLNDIHEINFAIGKNVTPVLIPDSMFEKIFSDLLRHQYGSKDYLFETFEKFLQKHNNGKTDILTIIDAITSFDSGVHQILISENTPIFVKKIGHFYKQSNKQVDRQSMLGYIKELTDEQLRKKLIHDSFIHFKKTINKYSYNITILKNKSHYSINVKKIFSIIPNIEKLINDKIFVDILTVPTNGIYFLTSPISHGKSMIMASLLNYFNKEKILNILTIEENIQFDIGSENSLITQYEINQVNYGYEKVIELVYDLEPDILMVSNLKDEKILELAMSFAEAGKPVILTFEAGSISGAFEKLFSSVDINKKSYFINKFLNLVKIVANFRMIPVHGVERKLLVYEYITAIAKIKKLIQDETYNFINSQLKGTPDFIPIEKKLAEMFLNNVITLETGERYSEDIEMFYRFIDAK
jgi:type IV pilus assembly protein PilB